MVSDELFVPLLVSTTVDGWNDPSNGRNWAESVTAPAKLFRLVRVIVNVVDEPTATVPVEGLMTTLKSGEPVSGEVWEAARPDFCAEKTLDPESGTMVMMKTVRMSRLRIIADARTCELIKLVPQGGPSEKSRWR